MKRFWSVKFHTNDVRKAESGSGLKSIVMHDPTSGVKFADNEPMGPFFEESQIDSFGGDHRGDGVQHAALTVEDIVGAVRGRRERGVEFMPTPGTHDDALPPRLVELGVGTIDEDQGVLRDLEIPVDGEKPHRTLLPELPQGVGRPVQGPRGRAVLLRDHPAQGLRGLRRRQLPRAVRVGRAPAAPRAPQLSLRVGMLVLLMAVAARAAPVTVSASDEGTVCARTPAGEVACWKKGLPSRVPGVEHVAVVALNQYDACVAHDDGDVTCWRVRFAAQKRPSTPRPTKMAHVHDVVELRAERATTCARRRDGHVQCWQRIDRSRSGEPMEPDYDTPLIEYEVPELADALEIAVAGTGGCARRASGEVACWTSEQRRPVARDFARGATSLAGGWGTDADGLFVATRASGRPVAWTSAGRRVELPVLPADTRRVVIGSRELCTADSAVHCFRKGSFNEDLAPVTIEGANGATALALGADVGCATVGNELRCWGRVDSTGRATPLTVQTPVAVPGLDDAIELASTPDQRMCARKKSGAIVCWSSTPPTAVEPRTNLGRYVSRAFARARARAWKGDRCRDSYSCVEKGGHVRCAHDFYGRAGDNDHDANYDGFGNLDGLRDLLLPHGCDDRVFIALTDGTVEIVDGADRTPIPGWQHVSRLTDIHGLRDDGTDGPRTVLGLRDDGRVVEWHEAVDDEKKVNSAKEVPGITDAVAIAATAETACVLRRTGQVLCWGGRDALGSKEPSYTDRAMPVELP